MPYGVDDPTDEDTARRDERAIRKERETVNGNGGGDLGGEKVNINVPPPPKPPRTSLAPNRL